MAGAGAAPAGGRRRVPQRRSLPGQRYSQGQQAGCGRCVHHAAEASHRSSTRSCGRGSSGSGRWQPAARRRACTPAAPAAAAGAATAVQQQGHRQQAAAAEAPCLPCRYSHQCLGCRCCGTPAGNRRCCCCCCCCCCCVAPGSCCRIAPSSRGSRGSRHSHPAAWRPRRLATGGRPAQHAAAAAAHRRIRSAQAGAAPGGAAAD